MFDCVLLIASVCAVSSAAPNDDVVDYLDLLISAHAADQGRYPRGELRATYEEGQSGEVTLQEHNECHVQWSGSRIWTRSRSWSREGDGLLGLDPERCVHTETIVDDVKTVTYHPSGRRVVVTPNATHTPPIVARLSPDNCWYSGWGGRGSSWLNALAPDTSPHNKAVGGIHFDQRRLEDDKVEVVRRGNAGYQLRMIFALSQDGNIQEYNMSDPESKIEIRGKCVWKPLSSQRSWYLESRDEQQTTYPHGVKTIQYKRYKTTMFNPDAQPPESRFAISSFQYPNGTTINDFAAKRVHKAGDLPVEKISQSLDELIIKMQSRGFARKQGAQK